MQITCPSCTKIFALKAPTGKVHLKTYPCPHCSTPFDVREQFAEIAQKEKEEAASKQFVDQLFASMESIENQVTEPTITPQHSSRKGPPAHDSRADSARPERKPTGQNRVPMEALAYETNPPPERRAPKQIGPYEILSEVARGGMGIVYKAQDPNLRRMVAIKVLLAGEGASEEDVKRFQRECQAAARLLHQSIVPIYATGLHEGRPYFVMDFVEGRTVKQLLEKGPLQPRLALSIAKDAAEALDHAARQGVVHRDVKPANIILGADNRARIMDFGLAKRLDEDLDITQSGTTMGTPAYMSPEQAEGDLAAVDERSDLYSLGAVLYEMLTGKPPFEGPTTLAVLRLVLDEDPIPPKQLNPHIHSDIDTICMKCLEKERGRRYKRAQDLAEDIRCFNAGEPISAVPQSWFTQFKRKAMKHKEITLGLLIAAGIAFLAISYSIWSASKAREDQERDRVKAADDSVQEGESQLKQLKQLSDDFTTLPPEQFQAQAEQMGLILKEAETQFRSALARIPEYPKARDGVDRVKKWSVWLEVEQDVREAQHFMEPPSNFDAARAFAERALRRDPKHALAQSIRKSALGIRNVTFHTDTNLPPNTHLYAQAVAETRNALDDIKGTPAGLPGPELGKAPVPEKEMNPAVYIVTLKPEGMAAQEAPLQVDREQDPTFKWASEGAKDFKERNMAYIQAGSVSMPQQGTVKVPPFLIDRYEFPNQAGRTPLTGISTLLEARAVCSKEGKTLCSTEQWLRACMTDEENKYPYGKMYQPGLCAVGLDAAARRTPFPAGWFPKCRTGNNVYDMSGNIWEWTDGDPDDEIVFGGDFTGDIHTPDLFISCRARQVPALANPERTGVRCCKAVK